jgi:hypothetical protein
MFFMRAALVIMAIASTEPAGPYQDKNRKQKEAVGNEKVVVKICHAQECGTGKKADDPGQHQQTAENAREIANVIDDIV